MDRAEFVVWTRTFSQRTPACPRAPAARSAEGGASGGCSLWLLSLAQARESDPRAGRARKTEWTRPQVGKDSAIWHPYSLDPGIPCRNDERERPGMHIPPSHAIIRDQLQPRALPARPPTRVKRWISSFPAPTRRQRAPRDSRVRGRA